jgi:hypothetical protein
MLPSFRYHPDPIATGSIKPSSVACICCGQARGYIYTASVYCLDTIREQLCPSCIADGSAAERFDAMFCDDHSLTKAGLAAEIIAEVTRRTLSCCDDACEFHGGVSRDELRSLSGAALDSFLASTGWTAAQLTEFAPNYQPGGSPAIYKFVCRHCKQPHYGHDCD